MIEIKCRGADILPLDAIEEFQGSLKHRSKSDIDKIIKSIMTYGFSFPFFVWQSSGRNYCLDGHGRIEALCKLRQSGENLPMFPVVYIEAADDAEARQKLLRLNSQYGTMTMDSVLEFTAGLEMQWDELELPAGDKMAFIAKDISFDEKETNKKELNDSDLSCCPKCGFKWQE
jgi:hypothetical protein